MRAKYGGQNILRRLHVHLLPSMFCQTGLLSVLTGGKTRDAREDGGFGADDGGVEE